MAYPKGAWTPQKVRERIQTTKLIQRLEDHALGKLDPELSKSQVAAIQILLKKTLPDLTSTELTGEGGGPVRHQVEIVDPTRRPNDPATP